jgi:segregation and condensation protein B
MTAVRTRLPSCSHPDIDDSDVLKPEDSNTEIPPSFPDKDSGDSTSSDVRPSSEASPMDQPLINRIVEAALLASSQPLTLTQLYGLFPEDQPAPADSVEIALQRLQDACAERGIELVEVASGFRCQVKAEVHPWVARLWTERQTKYTRATLETLALIAYRQPITRGEIEQVRGVAVSSNIIKALEERDWIRVVGHRDVPGKPALFGTTKTFLDYFGLKRLDELPPLSDLKDIGELEPQLSLGGEPSIPANAASLQLEHTEAAIAPDEAGTDDISSDSMPETASTRSPHVEGVAADASGIDDETMIDTAEADASAADDTEEYQADTENRPEPSA